MYLEIKYKFFTTKNVKGYIITLVKSILLKYFFCEAEYDWILDLKHNSKYSLIFAEFTPNLKSEQEGGSIESLPIKSKK
jgi:hypothetical protein